MLATTGRLSGRVRTVPVNLLQHDGSRYLVSTRGEAFWVRNLRANPQAELRRRGGVERIRALPVPAADVAPLVAAYRARWDGEAGQYFEKLPDLADHPVFRIEAA